MMGYLLYFPMGTGWELAFFVGLMAAWFVSDYVCNPKPKRSKRTERQIFDEPLEVRKMMARVITNDQFMKLGTQDQQRIVQLINNRYR